MNDSWKENIARCREELARKLHQPLANLAELCTLAWGDRDQLDILLMENFATIPHCTYLYCLNMDGIQICDNIGKTGPALERFGCDRSQRPYMKEPVPAWGFLLSDAYISLMEQRPALTALQLVRTGSATLGYLGADFDLRDLPVTASLYNEPGYWRQVKGDPAIRGLVFQQSRVESPMDTNLTQALSILNELFTQRGVFQCQIHFSSSQATIWTMDDPFRYRILDHEAMSDPDICMIFPPRAYPNDSIIPQHNIAHILSAMQSLRFADPTIYLRAASINIFNGMISLTFSCDGSHYMSYVEFLLKGKSFWY
jgi:hypothetical protein